MKRIAVVMAMSAEASPVLTALSAEAATGVAPLVLRWFTATRHRSEILIALNGRDRRFGVDSIGTEPAALSTYVAIDRFRPDVVISAGTAGGWERAGGAIGDVYVSDGCVVYHDRRIAIEGFREYGIGAYPVLPARQMAATLGLKTGIVTTSNSLDETDDDRLMISASGAAVKDMEAAAVAYVCEQMSVPFMALKAITDLVDHPEPVQDAFLRNLRMVSALLGERMEAGIRWLGGRPRRLAEL